MKETSLSLAYNASLDHTKGLNLGREVVYMPGKADLGVCWKSIEDLKMRLYVCICSLKIY